MRPSANLGPALLPAAGVHRAALLRWSLVMLTSSAWPSTTFEFATLVSRRPRPPGSPSSLFAFLITLQVCVSGVEFVLRAFLGAASGAEIRAPSWKLGRASASLRSVLWNRKGRGNFTPNICCLTKNFPIFLPARQSPAQSAWARPSRRDRGEGPRRNPSPAPTTRAGDVAPRPRLPPAARRPMGA